MAAIIHFDISAEDPLRCKAFYEQLCGWKFQLLPGPGNYFLVETADLLGKPGIGGGMSKRTDPSQTGITNFIGVASIDLSIRRVVELGGKVIQPKQTLPGTGYLAICMDTENNLIGLFQEEKAA